MGTSGIQQPHSVSEMDHARGVKGRGPGEGRQDRQGTWRKHSSLTTHTKCGFEKKKGKKKEKKRKAL